ncbi:hypothetical protein THAOC_36325 [Thalassiosira oceanica]|uniref:Uncharacterized protein n=1 Tax=Thalassiosira oceanica TaxID=159749 RepID=K0R0D1_THAOC|nr:hypothetical protein THAOC_36325 [Thalassiosira oceanica]|eukprot:EJK45080.1 hypothetical protein THAOC_36325 [Thalassiosira oceanica]
MHGVPFVSNSAELAYDPVEIPFVDVSSISQAIPLEDFGAPQRESICRCLDAKETATGTAIEPIQLWGDSTIFEVSGFESTPCNGGVFHRSSRVEAPAHAVTYVGQVICVLFAENLVEHWGSALSSAGWIHEGTRDGFSYRSEVLDLVDLGATPPAILSRCQGDCDNDSHCKGDLECFERDPGEDGPPGCLGSPYNDVDYCHDPNWEVQIEDVATEPVDPLSRCQGDCDSDSECEGDLLCWFRNEGDGIGLPPGCLGSFYSDYDYCYQPLPTLEDFGATPVNETLPKQCEGDLKCFQRDGDTPVPGCTDSGAGVNNHDYCYDEVVEPLVLFCQHGELSARLPPFPDLGAGGGMAHGICSL